MTIIEQLTRLAEIAPEVCKVEPFTAIDNEGNEYPSAVYAVGEYVFYQHHEFGFSAVFRSSSAITGQPALDWLQCALQRTIEGLDIAYSLGFSKKSYYANIGWWYNGESNTAWAEALLIALIKMLGDKE